MPAARQSTARVCFMFMVGCSILFADMFVDMSALPQMLLRAFVHGPFLILQRARLVERASQRRRHQHDNDLFDGHVFREIAHVVNVILWISVCVPHFCFSIIHSWNHRTV